jgi:hypothetical protein
MVPTQVVRMGGSTFVRPYFIAFGNPLDNRNTSSQPESYRLRAKTG